MRRPVSELTRFAPRASRSYIVGPDGRIEVDPAKRNILPFTLVTEPEAVFVPAAIQMGSDADGVPILMGGVAANPAIMPIDNKGPIEICYASFKAKFLTGPNEGDSTDQFMVYVFDAGERSSIMNRELHARSFAGGFGDPLGAGFAPALDSAGGRPLVWPETLFLEPEDNGKAIYIGFRNLTTEAIEVRWSFPGVRYWNLNTFEEARKEKEEMVGKGRVSWPYFYTTDTNIDLAAGARERFDLRVTDDADVEIFKMTHFSNFPFLWRIMEKTSGQRFLDTAGVDVAGLQNGVHSDFGWGNGEFPFIPFETFYFEQNTKLQLQIVNTLSGLARNRIYTTFVCRKIAHVER